MAFDRVSLCLLNPVLSLHDYCDLIVNPIPIPIPGIGRWPLFLAVGASCFDCVTVDGEFRMFRFGWDGVGF